MRVKNKNAPPNIASGALKGASECSTLVLGSPAKYAARKTLMKTAPTPCRVNKSFSVFLSMVLDCIHLHLLLSQLSWFSYLRLIVFRDFRRLSPPSGFWMELDLLNHKHNMKLVMNVFQTDWWLLWLRRISIRPSK